MSVATQSPLTPSDFFTWEAEQSVKHEHFYGEVFSMAGGTPEHALIMATLGYQLVGGLRDGPCRAFSSELAVEIDTAGHFSYPDATVVCGMV